LHYGSRENAGHRSVAVLQRLTQARLKRCARLALLTMTLLLASVTARAAEPPLPDAPGSQLPAKHKPPAPGPCQANRSVTEAAQAAAVGAAAGAGDAAAGINPESVLQPKPCPPLTPIINWYARFLNGPQVKPLSPKEKARLAARNVLDPFNAITILGSSAIAVG